MFNDNISINKRTMILHCVLLTLQNLVVFVWAFDPYIPILINRSNLIYIVLTGIDVIVQLMICFICVTMGSHINLRKFKITLDITSGAPKVIFKRNSDNFEQRVM